MNWRLAAPEVTALLDLMRPAAVVSDTDCAGLAKQALAGLDGTEPALLGLGEPGAWRVGRAGREGSSAAGRAAARPRAGRFRR